MFSFENSNFPLKCDRFFRFHPAPLGPICFPKKIPKIIMIISINYMLPALISWVFLTLICFIHMHHILNAFDRTPFIRAIVAPTHVSMQAIKGKIKSRPA